MSDKTVKKSFRCPQCSEVKVAPYDARLDHCGVAMEETGDPIFPEGNPKEIRLHLLKTADPPNIDWSAPDPRNVFELWRLAPGRAKGERLGYVGEFFTTCEWHTPAGVGIRSGRAPDITRAVQAILLALDGGVHAPRLIAEICS